MTTEIIPLTPLDLTKTLSNTNVQQLDMKAVRVRGVYLYNPKSDKYNGCYYDKLQDEVTGEWMTLKVPEVWRKNLKNNTPYVLEGTIDRKVVNNFNELGIHLAFRVTKIVGEEAPLIDEKLREAAEILSARRAKPRQFIETSIRLCFKEGKKPRVAMIAPRTGKTDMDVERAIEEQRRNYDVEMVPISLINKMEIINTLRRLDESGEYDLITIFRGGGPGLDVFDDNNIARTVVEMGTPLVTGIGHAEDTPFIEMVADQAFATPTALGYHLQRIAEDVTKDISWLAQYEEDEKRYQQTIRQLKDEQGRRDAKHQQDVGTLIEQRNELQTKINRLYEVRASQPATVEPTEVEQRNNYFKRHVAAALVVGMFIGLLMGLAVSYLFGPFGQRISVAPTIQAAPGETNQSSLPPATPQAVNGNTKNSRNKVRRP